METKQQATRAQHRAAMWFDGARRAIAAGMPDLAAYYQRMSAESAAEARREVADAVAPSQSA